MNHMDDKSRIDYLEKLIRGGAGISIPLGYGDTAASLITHINGNWMVWLKAGPQRFLTFRDSLDWAEQNIKDACSEVRE